ncbi:phosphotransferase [Kitasatospora sp. NPDC057198]|uniref:phosphotransferase n=1 Tax=Kitasatospora sp. NPDC057198 TaxID=3346046 RepID=UPI00363DDF2A
MLLHQDEVPADGALVRGLLAAQCPQWAGLPVVAAGAGGVRDWAGFGADLADFVRELHGAGLQGARRAGELSWYRGGGLREVGEAVGARFDECRALLGRELDVDALEGLWRSGLALPEPSGPHGWLHGDLGPSNLLVREGRLSAVIDVGCRSVGHPDPEHAAVWDLPPEVQRAWPGGAVTAFP